MIIYTFPIISALIGWFTNFLAVKMLFRPREEVDLYIFKLQGVFPKRQKKLASSIGRMVALELLSTDDIKVKINTPESVSMMLGKVSEKLDDYLNNRLSQKYPIISTFLTEGVRTKIKNEFLSELEVMVPSMIDNFMDSIDKTFDVEATIREKVELLSSKKLEDLIMGILSKEFRFLELIGALVGFIIGCFQVAMVQIGL